jgi:hypothetical protein
MNDEIWKEVVPEINYDRNPTKIKNSFITALVRAERIKLSSALH